MINLEPVLFWAHVAAGLLIGLSVLQIGLYALRALRAGQSGIRVLVAVTSAVIGLGIALALSWLGGRAVATLLAPTVLPAVPLIAAQFAGALAASWAAVLVYAKWLAPVVTG